MTAVEFLIKQICGEHTDAWKEVIQQALEMEKHQMLHFWQGGLLANESGGKNFEEYYNEKYKHSA
jgi:phosphosulfolactate synthase (CoM biosynthesis protein A)